MKMSQGKKSFCLFSWSSHANEKALNEAGFKLKSLFHFYFHFQFPRHYLLRMPVPILKYTQTFEVNIKYFLSVQIHFSSLGDTSQCW